VRRVLAVLLGLLLVVACGGGSGGDGESVSGDDVVVDMFDNRYEFTEVNVTVGGTVTFVGAGRNPHNAVAADGSWSTEDVFGSLEQLEGDEAVLTFDEAGEYPFFCTFHGNAEGDGMAGTLVVAPAGE
jgi:plastocyanin